MLEEKKFKKIIMAITLIVIVAVGLMYFLYYKKQPVLNNEQVKVSETKTEMPILPFDAFSMLKEDLMVKFGEGEKGSGEDFDTQYIDYNQKWFGKDFKARYYYGLYNRIYQINLYVNKNDIQSVYDEMKIQLGAPIYDKFFDKKMDLEDKVTYWIKDSVRYSILYDEGKCTVKMKLEYYSNPGKLNIGDRPTVIQRQNNVEGIVPGEKANILLIGDKPKYTSRYYKNIYVVIGSKSGTYLGRMPKENDGGLYPRFYLQNLDNSEGTCIVVETDNEYTKWYTGFEYKDKKINVIYSNEKNPSNN